MNSLFEEATLELNKVFEVKNYSKFQNMLKLYLNYPGKYSKGLIYGFLYGMSLNAAIKNNKPIRRVKVLYKAILNSK